MNNFRIPLYKPSLGEGEKKALLDAFDSSWISSKGPKIVEFEEEVSRFTGSKFGISTSNGTTALHLAFASLQLKFGDEVLMPSLTYVATATPALYLGLNVRLCDVNPETWMPAKSDFEDSINASTRVLTSVDLFGMPSGDWVTDLAQSHSLRHVNDGAESLGSFANGEHAGKRADVNTLSFFANKTITTGEGGMIVCNSEIIAEKCKKYRNLAFEPNGRRFIHNEIGYNYRLPNINAAIGCAQMESLPKLLESKRYIANAYSDFFSESNKKFVNEPVHASSNYWLNALVLADKQERENFLKRLNDAGVMSRPVWRLMNELPMFSDCQSADLTNAKWLEERVVNIPSSARL
jgi:dTDP-4-amino-4,6-dideoxygalactose transaminase